MVTALIAGAILSAALGPFLLDALLCGRRSARLHLAERAQEAQTTFIDGVGPVRRATVRDVRDAADRLARTAWRARTIARPRTCTRRPDGRRDAAGRRVVGRPTVALPPLPRPRPRTCAPRVSPTAWWPTAPKPIARPGLTPLQVVVQELRGDVSLARRLTGTRG